MVFFRSDQVEKVIAAIRGAVEFDRVRAEPGESPLGRFDHLLGGAGGGGEGFPVPFDRFGEIGRHTDAVFVVVGESEHSAGRAVIGGIAVEFELFLGFFLRQFREKRRAEAHGGSQRGDEDERCFHGSECNGVMMSTLIVASVCLKAFFDGFEHFTFGLLFLFFVSGWFIF